MGEADQGRGHQGQLMLTVADHMTVSRSLAAFFAGLQYGNVPEAVAQHMKLLLVDAFGVAVAAASTPLARQVTALAVELGGAPRCSIIGTGQRVAAANAALANGYLVNALDYDDTYMEAIIHTSCCIVPAMLAAGEDGHADGRTALTAAIAGSELMLRLARAGKNNLFRRNFHTLGLLGPLGAAMTASRIMGLDADATTNALGIAAGLGGGVLQSLAEGKSIKAFRAGYAAHGGIVAARLAARGVTGPAAALEGPLGLFPTYLPSNEFDLEELVAGLGSTWHVPGISVKMFPGGHRSHYFVESALRLRQQHAINAGQIASVCCTSSPNHLYYNFTEAGYAPANDYMARFSVPYLVSVALLDGAITPASMAEPRIRDPETLRVARLVTCRIAPDADLPDQRGRVSITLHDGRTFEHQQKHIEGTPEHPASVDAIVRKFRVNATPQIGEQRAARLEQSHLQLEDVADLRTVAELMA